MKKNHLIKPFIILSAVIFISFCLAAPVFSQTDELSEDAKLEQIITCIMDKSTNKQAGAREAESVEQKFADGVYSFTQQPGWTKVNICEIDVWIKPKN